MDEDGPFKKEGRKLLSRKKFTFEEYERFVKYIADPIRVYNFNIKQAEEKLEELKRKRQVLLNMDKAVGDKFKEFPKES